MLTKSELIEQLIKLGVSRGDVIFLRSDLSKVGKYEGKLKGFLSDLLDYLGPEGTLIAPAFTSGASYIKMPKVSEAFNLKKISTSGFLPNLMLIHPNAFRSTHPMCSFVAIGAKAEEIIDGHDKNSPAYAPIAKLVKLNAKSMLIGCVSTSPGFTTTHLAEFDLGLYKRNIFPRLIRAYYMDGAGIPQVFHRKDPGLCGKSYWKFYSHYVSAGILSAGFIGNAYSILVPTDSAYAIEKSILSTNPQFNICDDKDCYVCNARRWDRLHKLPLFYIRILIRKFKRLF